LPCFLSQEHFREHILQEEGWIQQQQPARGAVAEYDFSKPGEGKNRKGIQESNLDAAPLRVCLCLENSAGDGRSWRITICISLSLSLSRSLLLSLVRNTHLQK
jgi:hypothetical protein